MAKVNICNVNVKDNPCPFLHPFQFEITFECIEDLNEDLEWKITYVGSAESEEFDQTLDTVVVGPIIAGRHMFVFEADPPDAGKIPREDVVGVTVVLLTCAYRGQEFIRVGYYVNNEYPESELKENPPLEPDFTKLQRNILATCPRVTRFKIDWGDGNDVENQPPATSTGNESNQMAIEGDAGKQVLKESVTGFTGNGLCGSAADSNGMDLAAAAKVFAAQNKAAAAAEEPMQM